MPEQQFKRNIAYKFKIGDLLMGKPIFDGERFSFLDFGNKKIVRVNVVANIVDRYDSEGEKKYSFITVDDGSGQIKLKSFGDDVDKLKSFLQGQTVLIIGVLRHFNNELYIFPEIVKEIDTQYLSVRKLELEKKEKASAPIEKKEIIAIKDKILEAIKSSEDNGGIEVDKIILDFKDTSPEVINTEIKKLLEEGIIFEPRPGKIRWLG
jgi:RecG-like helicase